MTNNTESGLIKKVSSSIAEAFESNIVTTKTLSTGEFDGGHDPRTGQEVYTQRYQAFNAVETTDLNLTSLQNDLLVGSTKSVIQPFISLKVGWSTVEEAFSLGNLQDRIGDPIGTALVTRMETRTNEFILKNAGLSYGTPGTAVDAWSDVAGPQALLDASGVPMNGKAYYQLNPFVGSNLANVQLGLAGNGEVKEAWKTAMINDLAGMAVLKSNAMATYTTGTSAARAGTLSATPDATWATHKDTMRQTLSLTGFTAAGTIKAGEVIEITGKYHINPNTRQTLYDGTGTAIKYRGTVYQDVTLDGSGDGDVIISNAAIYDAASNNQYDTVSGALASGDVVTLLGAATTPYQPSMFYHKDAFTLATHKLPKLFSTDTNYQSKDGIQFRVSKWADGNTSKNFLRVDLCYALGVNNSLWAGKGFGK